MSMSEAAKALLKCMEDENLFFHDIECMYINKEFKTKEESDAAFELIKIHRD